MSSIKIPKIVLLLAGITGLLGWTLALLVLCRRIDVLGPGTDWLAFYGAARAYLDGHLTLIFEPARFTALLNSEFSWWLAEPLAFRPWVYPPSFLLLLLPFGALPLALSYILFQLASGAVLAGALAFAADRPAARWLVMGSAFLCFGAADNVMQGQNGFLTAALLVGGWRAIRTRPLVGGAILGVLTFKPQFWLLVPVALVAAREWKALFASVAAAAALAAASVALFGIEAWVRWIEFALHPNDWTASARIFGTSYFAFIAGIGLPWKLAEAVQAAAAAGSAVLVYVGCRREMPRDQQLAVLLAAALIAAPHSSYYDTVLLAIAATLWIVAAAEERSPLLRSELALFVWSAPLFEAEVYRGFVPVLASALIGVALIGPLMRRRTKSAGVTGRLSTLRRSIASRGMRG